MFKFFLSHIFPFYISNLAFSIHNLFVSHLSYNILFISPVAPQAHLLLWSLLLALPTVGHMRVERIVAWLSYWWSDIGILVWLSHASFLLRYGSRAESPSKWLLGTWADSLVLWLSLILPSLVSSPADWVFKPSQREVGLIHLLTFWVGMWCPGARMKALDLFSFLKINSLKCRCAFLE